MKGNSMKKKIIVILLILFIAIATYISKKYMLKEKDTIVYSSAKAQISSIQLNISAAGTICPKKEIEIKSKASGEILKLLAKDGDYVKKGQLLIELDKTEEQTKVNQALADVMVARARVDQAKEYASESKRNYQNQNLLYKEKMISEETMLKAQSQMNIKLSDLTIASANLLSAREKLKNARLSYADTEIRSPIDGIVLEKLVEEGQIISSGISASTGGTIIMTIGDMDKLISLAEVDEVDIGKLEIGQQTSIQVDAYEGKSFQGILSHISPKGENKSNVTVFSIEVNIIDQDKHLLKAGMTNTAQIIYADKQNIITIPSTALLNGKRRQFVLIKQGDDYIRKQVLSGLNDYQQVEITDGLEAGDTIYYTTKKIQRSNSQKDKTRAQFRAMRKMSK